MLIKALQYFAFFKMLFWKDVLYQFAPSGVLRKNLQLFKKKRIVLKVWWCDVDVYI